MRRSNEKLLIARVMLLDDRRAFATLVELHQPAVRRFFLHQTMGNEMLTDDLAQETFIKLYYSFRQYKGLSSLSTYLYRIAYNVFHDHLRRHSLEDTTDQMPDHATESDTDTAIDLAHALQQLSPVERAAVSLHYIEGHRVEDVAQILSMPTGTAKSHLSRARSKLAQYLKNNGYE